MDVETIDTLQKLVNGQTVSFMASFQDAKLQRIYPNPHIEAIQRQGLSVSCKESQMLGGAFLSCHLPENQREGGKELLRTIENKGL